MNEDRRDTQFAVSARLLLQEIKNTQKRLLDSMDDGLMHSFAEWDEEITRVIGAFAYDFACHVSTHTVLTAHGDMSKIPDMTGLPEESRE